METLPAQSQAEAGRNFFSYFRREVTALQDQMEVVEHTSSIGGERADALDHCMAGIARLSGEVQEATRNAPPHDQQIYSEGVKALFAKLAETRIALTPKPKFSFKTSRKNNSAISLEEAAELAKSLRPGHAGDTSTSSAASSQAPTPVPGTNPPLPAPLSSSGQPVPVLEPGTPHRIHKPSFSAHPSITLASHASTHIILPSSASHATSSGSVTSLRSCVIDMSVPTASGRPFAGLTLRDVRDSLVLCGHVSGAIHITGVSGSTLVVACNQFRMHDCTDVDVYLLCKSRPVIEDCKGVRFAPLPDILKLNSDRSVENHWDRVDDFKWLHAEHSPHWSILPDKARVPERVWTEVVPGGPDIALDAILKQTVAVGLAQAA
ncbi:MAG: hypothetical protein M1825_004898 [Sarcosagium campestre]|nr:MAG: hypothetical protein M1825_004898 [Sarcosagium campestre]